MRNTLARFYICTFAGSWLFWIPLILSDRGIIGKTPTDLLIMLGIFAPTITALLLTGLGGSGRAVKDLARRAVQFKFSASCYGMIFLLMPGVLGFSFLAAKLLAGLEFESFIIPMLKEQPLAIIPIFLYMLVLQGPLGEEFGWRGFALDRLLTKHSPLSAAIVLGLIWSLWHLPLFFVEGTIQNGVAANGLAIALIGYSLYTLLLSILMTVVHIRTGGSILAALLFHTTANLSHGLITILTSLSGGAAILITLTLVTGIVAVRSKGLTAPPPPQNLVA